MKTHNCILCYAILTSSILYTPNCFSYDSIDTYLQRCEQIYNDYQSKERCKRDVMETNRKNEAIRKEKSDYQTKQQQRGNDARAERDRYLDEATQDYPELGQMLKNSLR